ncbi:MAG: hypothetical protein K8S54_02770 [Spirochaetia bacterium]|nr:hypothetical protein [Spirochaetia bacterium]
MDMVQIGAIVLSFEEAGDLSELIPWKSQDAWLLRDQLMQAEPALVGFVPISTCNRIEFYYSLNNAAAHYSLFDALLGLLPPLAPGVRPNHLLGRDAARHLIRLATGLESMVLGETEIRAQLKDAYEAAARHHTLDRRLRILFQQTFQESRTIRASIPMDRLPLSVATIATRHLLRRIAPQALNLKEARLQGTAVVIGSGPMSRQSAEALSRYFSSIVIVNRTLEKVAPLARRLEAESVEFSEFLANPGKFFKTNEPGVIVTATSRPDAFITPEVLGRVFDRGVPQLALVDLALPHDVSSGCTDDSRVQLITMDSIRPELEGNRQKRAEAAAMAGETIETALIRIEASIISGVSSTLLREIQKEIRDKSRQELETLLSHRLSHLRQKDIRMLYDWAIRAHREMNRIHKRGLESVLTHYYGGNGEPGLSEHTD